MRMVQKKERKKERKKENSQILAVTASGCRSQVFCESLFERGMIGGSIL